VNQSFLKQAVLERTVLKQSVCSPRRAWLAIFSTVFLLGFLATAHAATDSIEINYLALDEAAAAARSQLSKDGKLAQLASRRLLIITDDETHLKQVRKLLKTLDIAAPQLLVHIEISERDAEQNDAAAVQLSGGWMRVQSYKNQSHQNVLSSQHQRQFSLRTTSGTASRIEAGEVRSERANVRRYLANHGIIHSVDAIEYVEITAGFDVQATLLAGNKVRVRIHPWFALPADDADFQGKTEILVNLGNTAATARPPANSAPIRLNMQSGTNAESNNNSQVIYVADAQTELTIEAGKSITLASVQHAAHAFSNALIGASSLHQERDLLIQLQVKRVQ